MTKYDPFTRAPQNREKRKTSKDVLDVLDSFEQQKALNATLRLEQYKRNTFLTINGLGTALSERIESKMVLLKELKSKGLWDES